MGGIPGVGVLGRKRRFLKTLKRDLDVSPQKAKAERNDLAQKR